MKSIPQAYLGLGRLYENGTGVEADAATAAEYYQQAADAAQESLDAGNADAQAVPDDATAGLDTLAD